MAETPGRDDWAEVVKRQHFADTRFARPAALPLLYGRTFRKFANKREARGRVAALLGPRVRSEVKRRQSVGARTGRRRTFVAGGWLGASLKRAQWTRASGPRFSDLANLYTRIHTTHISYMRLYVYIYMAMESALSGAHFAVAPRAVWRNRPDAQNETHKMGMRTLEIHKRKSE